MSLLVDVQLVPNRILEVVKARILANRERWLQQQQQGAQLKAPTRPRPQRPRFGATATTYRRPEPAAVGGMKFDVVAFDVEGIYLDDDFTQPAWKITVNDGTEKVIPLPVIQSKFLTAYSDLEAVAIYNVFGYNYADKEDSEFGYVSYQGQIFYESNPLEYGQETTERVRGFHYTEQSQNYYTFYQALDFNVIPLGSKAALLIIPGSYLESIVHYEREYYRKQILYGIAGAGNACPLPYTVGDNGPIMFEGIRVYHNEVVQTFSETIEEVQTTQIDFTKAFVITNSSITEVQLSESTLSTLSPFCKNFANRTVTLKPSTDFDFYTYFPNGFSQDYYYDSYEVTQDCDGSSLAPVIVTYGSATEDIVPAQVLSVSQRPDVDAFNVVETELSTSPDLTTFGSVKYTAYGPGVFTLLANPSLDLPIGTPASEIIASYLQGVPLPNKSIGIATAGSTSPTVVPDTWGTYPGPYVGPLPPGANLTLSQVKTNPEMGHYVWDWGKPAYCKQQLDALGITWAPVEPPPETP